MFHILTPEYLSDLVPPLVSNLSNYSLRNRSDFQLPLARTTFYYNSFIPSAVREYNALPPPLKQATSLASFKRLLNSNKNYVSKYYFTGNRSDQILHARLRTHCSALAHDLHSKNIIDSPYCTCGSLETTNHFFLACPQYNNIRTDLLNSVSRFTTVALHVLLFGDTTKSFDVNVSIFKAVHTYIKLSKRFDNNS